jgi:hypothetical protein
MAVTSDEIKYSNTTKIAGAAEDYAADVVLDIDNKGRLAVDTKQLTTSVFGAITVSTSAVEAKVGASKLTGRRLIIVTPTTGKLFFGTSNAVTTANGTPLANNQTLYAELPSVWLIAASGSVNVRIVESA